MDLVDGNNKFVAHYMDADNYLGHYLDDYYPPYAKYVGSSYVSDRKDILNLYEAEKSIDLDKFGETANKLVAAYNNDFPAMGVHISDVSNDLIDHWQSNAGEHIGKYVNNLAKNQTQFGTNSENIISSLNQGKDRIEKAINQKGETVKSLVDYDKIIIWNSVTYTQFGKDRLNKMVDYVKKSGRSKGSVLWSAIPQDERDVVDIWHNPLGWDAKSSFWTSHIDSHGIDHVVNMDAVYDWTFQFCNTFKTQVETFRNGLTQASQICTEEILSLYDVILQQTDPGKYPLPIKKPSDVKDPQMPNAQTPGQVPPGPNVPGPIGGGSPGGGGMSSGGGGGGGVPSVPGQIPGGTPQPQTQSSSLQSQIDELKKLIEGKDGKDDKKSDAKFPDIGSILNGISGAMSKGLESAGKAVGDGTKAATDTAKSASDIAKNIASAAKNGAPASSTQPVPATTDNGKTTTMKLDDGKTMTIKTDKDGNPIDVTITDKDGNVKHIDPALLGKEKISQPVNGDPQPNKVSVPQTNPAPVTPSVPSGPDVQMQQPPANAEGQTTIDGPKIATI